MSQRRTQGKVVVVEGVSVRKALASVRAAIRDIYARPAGAAGCCLHLVTDDRNFDDGAIRLCLEQANRRRHAVCAYVAQFYLDAPRATRRRI